LNEAKELFIKYVGSHYQMERVGVLDKYRKYNINFEIEKGWLNEYFTELIEKLDSSESPDIIFSRLCNVMKATKSSNKMEYLMEVLNLNITNWDSFIRLRIAEELQDLIDFFSKNYKEQLKEILKFKNIALDIFKSIIHEQIVISEETRKHVALEDILNEKNLKKRAELGLKRLHFSLVEMKLNA